MAVYIAVTEEIRVQFPAQAVSLFFANLQPPSTSLSTFVFKYPPE